MIWYYILFIVIYIISAIIALAMVIAVYKGQSCYVRMICCSFTPVINTVLAIISAATVLAVYCFGAKQTGP